MKELCGCLLVCAESVVCEKKRKNFEEDQKRKEKRQREK